MTRHDTGTKSLLTEAQNAASIHIDSMETQDIIHLISQEDKKIALAVAEQSEQIATAVDAITERLFRGGHLVYVGAGTSGRLGVLDASECPPTFGVAPDIVRGVIAGGRRALWRSVEAAEDDQQTGAEAMAQERIAAQDVVVGITASGRTPFVVGALKAAREVGAYTVGLACNRPSTIENWVDVMIAPLVGPEVLSGSTRMKAGTAQKMVLNMLTTASMIRLGKTYGNLMVDVQATNEKLYDRATRIVCQVCEVTQERAVAALELCQYEVKTAIVMIKLDLSAEQARTRLVQTRGFVRQALEKNE